jgi:hypothetical protein|tara:strand:+ start:51521 stop:52138 length:618 start_codon:yes stop_codon:yes gene_type:complete
MTTIKGWHASLIAEKVKSIFDEKGYSFFDGNSSWNINIIGIRNSCAKANKFDDMMLVVYRNGRKNWEVKSYQITTDPGKYWLKKPMNVGGTAIMVPGQYRGVYKIGTHRSYTALVQRGGKVKCYRDKNKDEILDYDPDSITEGYYGINIHKAGSDSTNVDKWSAGCQVFARTSEFNDFMKLAKKSEGLYGDMFSYSLITEEDWGV